MDNNPRRSELKLQAQTALLCGWCAGAQCLIGARGEEGQSLFVFGSASSGMILRSIIQSVGKREDIAV